MRSRARESMVRESGSFVVGGRSAVALTFFFCVFWFVVLLLRGVRFVCVAGGRSATSAVFFRSPAALRSFFFFALVLRGVRYFAFYNHSTVMLAFVIFPRFVLKRNPLFYKLKAYFFSKKRIEINKNQ